MASSIFAIAIGALVAILGFVPDFPNFEGGSATAQISSRAPEPGTFALASNSKLLFTRRSAGPRAAASAGHDRRALPSHAARPSAAMARQVAKLAHQASASR
jgi:hypothetical protein